MEIKERTESIHLSPQFIISTKRSKTHSISLISAKEPNNLIIKMMFPFRSSRLLMIAFFLWTGSTASAFAIISSLSSKTFRYQRQPVPNPLPSRIIQQRQGWQVLHVSQQYHEHHSITSDTWAAMADAAAKFTSKMLAFAANGGRYDYDTPARYCPSTATDDARGAATECYDEPQQPSDSWYAFNDEDDAYDTPYYSVDDSYNNNDTPYYYVDDTYNDFNRVPEDYAYQEGYTVEEDPYLAATDQIMQETVAFLQKDQRVTDLLGLPPFRLQCLGTSGDVVNFDVFGSHGSGIVSVVASIFTGDLISIKFQFQGTVYYLFNGLNNSNHHGIAPATTTASVKSQRKGSHDVSKDHYVREDDFDYDDAVRAIEVEILDGIRRSSSATKRQAVDADILDRDVTA